MPDDAKNIAFTPAGGLLDLETRTLREISRRFLPLLLIAYVVSYLDRVNVPDQELSSVALAEQLLLRILAG